MGPWRSGVEFLPGSLPPIYDKLEIGRWIPFGSIGHISCVGYKLARAPIDQAMLLPIGRINDFIGIVSSSDSAGSPGDEPILEDLDDSGNTIVPNNDVDSNDGPNSILPVLDYESDDGSIGLVSDGSTTLAAIYMAAPANGGGDPVDPNT
jgi:hypothetical protein